MKKVKRLLVREFRLFAANKVFVFSFTLLPLLLATVLGFVYQKGKVDNVPILVVDLDQTPASHRFRDMLDNNRTIRVVQTVYESTGLQQSLLDRRAAALVTIPYRFEEKLLAGKRPEINAYLNMANTISANAAGAAINACAATMNASMSQNPPAFRSNIMLQFNPAGNYLFFLWPALIFSVLHQLLLLALAVSFSGEYQRGSFATPGLLAISRSPLLLIGIKLIPYVCMSLITGSIYYLLGRLFRLPPTAEPGILLVSQFFFIVGAGLLGILYSIMIPIPLKATQLLMSISSPAFTISGFTWPSDQAPELLRWIGQAIPLTPYLRTLRLLVLQRSGLEEVLPLICHQLILVAVLLSLSWLALSIKIKNTVSA